MEKAKTPAPAPSCGEEKQTISPRGKKVASIFAIAVFVLLSVAAFWFVGRPLMEYISDPQGFRIWVDAHGILGKLCFVGLMALQVVIAIIPGEPLEIFAGYAFGFWQGTLLCLAGALLGSVIVFMLVRTFGIKLVEAFFPIEKIHSASFVRDAKRLNLLVFIVFFIPGTPKDILAYVVGLTPMKLSVWVLITLTARIPSVITSTIGGDALGTQNYAFAAVVFGVTLIISALGLLAYKRLSKKQN